MKKLSLMLSLIASTVLLLIVTAHASQALPTTQSAVFSGGGTAGTPYTNVCSDYVISAYSPGYARVRFLDVITDGTAGVNCKFYTATNSTAVTTAVATTATNILTTNVFGIAANATCIAVARSVTLDKYQALHVKSINGAAAIGETLAFPLLVGDYIYQMTSNGGLTTAVNTDLQVNAQGGEIYVGKRFSPELLEVVGVTNAVINLVTGDFLTASGLNAGAP